MPLAVTQRDFLVKRTIKTYHSANHDEFGPEFLVDGEDVEDPEPEHHETDGQDNAARLNTLTTVYVPHDHSCIMRSVKPMRLEDFMYLKGGGGGVLKIGISGKYHKYQGVKNFTLVARSTRE